MTNGVVSRLAARTLLRYEELIEPWLAQVLAIEPYAQGLVPVEEVRGGARIVLGLILRELADGRPSTELTAHSERMGERRAGQGMPLDSLLAAARLDAKVLWQGLVAQADPADLTELLEAAYLVWEAVERHNTGLMTGYQRAVLEMGRQREDERRTWFARLLDNDGRNPDVVRDAGRILGFDPEATFVVLAADRTTTPVPDPGVVSLRGAASGLGLRLHLHDSPSGELLVVQVPARGAAPDLVLRAVAGVPCGVAPPVAGLAAVPHAVRLAAATARLATPEGGPLRLEDAWLDVFARQSPDLAGELATRVLGPLAALGQSERERLLETVRTHLAGDGSIAGTAAALYCHRNTVQHRFGRFKEVTGRDVRAPADAAVVALALRAATFL
ncbi:PucR family transcriptional regulator [Nonomuraea sp. NPDC050328]|uniref:PucR family transcriptional regulator n=1 Tax=Nonomuraea sp. NPDC050328 TaxID=3364361 RepID=UPI00379B74CE